MVECLFIGDFLAINNGLLMDLVNPSVLQCIICRFEQASSNALTQKSTFYKGLIKLNKTNGIIPMIAYVQITNLQLFA
jgi:hypothetical protein